MPVYYCPVEPWWRRGTGLVPETHAVLFISFGPQPAMKDVEHSNKIKPFAPFLH